MVCSTRFFEFTKKMELHVMVLILENLYDYVRRWCTEYTVRILAFIRHLGLRSVCILERMRHRGLSSAGQMWMPTEEQILTAFDVRKSWHLLFFCFFVALRIQEHWNSKTGSNALLYIILNALIYALIFVSLELRPFIWVILTFWCSGTLD